MCGFAGIFASNLGQRLITQNILENMGSKILHRGPDDGGCWINETNELGLVHRRLSILDLSPNGHQPMHSNSGIYTIAFNGEIYNHLELRNQLKNINWRGTSDTETLLEAFDNWGVEKTLSLSRGMFAFALWNKKTKELILARDRFGEKPLYYGWCNNTFLFGSELKSLKTHPSFINEVDSQSLSNFIYTGFITQSKSIYKNISKLDPGSILTLNSSNNSCKISKYWDSESLIMSSTSNIFKGTEIEASQLLEDLLVNVLSEQMMADVPLGAFLSGGVDSSLIVALMQRQSSSKIKTFTIGFDDKKYNEAIYAKDVANYLKTDHTEVYLSSKDALETVPLLPELYDEPFADSSQIPTYLVSKVTKEKVTVSLSGDAGDELFCGYNRYIAAEKYWSAISKTPNLLRKSLYKILTNINPIVYDKLLGSLTNNKQIGNLIHKGSEILISADIEDLYSKLISQNNLTDNIMKSELKLSINHSSKFDKLSVVERMMAYDLINYLPDDILVKVDRAAMHTSLETRVPFLDHRVVNFAWSLPIDYKYKNGTSKKILRNILYKHVPKNLIERPKMGFGVPLDYWLRNALKDWGENLLMNKNIDHDAFFNTKALNKLWLEHQKGKKNNGKKLWNILMFLAWYEYQNKN
jgi:asparagine synthase (glutamine-hydrolysing)